MIDRLGQVNSGQIQEDLHEKFRFGFLSLLLPFVGPSEAPLRRAGWETPGSTVCAENDSLSVWRVPVQRRSSSESALFRGRRSMEENERSVSQETADCRLNAQPSDQWPRTAAVETEWCSPDMPTARLALPGVMDAEGRVDESRLRMHIFKNGIQ